MFVDSSTLVYELYLFIKNHEINIKLGISGNCLPENYTEHISPVSIVTYFSLKVSNFWISLHLKIFSPGIEFEIRRFD